ncbi:MAG TPA: EAL domain-containing protein [Moraxellaceae bacterium]
MKALRLLMLEDTDTDAEIISYTLKSQGLDADICRVQDEAAYTAALVTFRPDLILADYTLPGFSGLEALAIRNERARSTPFIFVSGSLGEEKAVETLRTGATDYVLKDRLHRLPAAVTRALQEAKQREDKQRIAAELEAERKLIRAIQDTAKALIIVIDAQGHIQHINPEAARVLGQPRLQLIGSIFWNTCVSEHDTKATRHQLRLAFKSARKGSQVWRATSRNGQAIMWSSSILDTGVRQSSRIVLCGIDITAQEIAEERVHFLDNFDEVTGLPNRKLFLQQLTSACEKFTLQPDHKLVVMLISFPRFDEIRDSRGEAVINHIMAVMVQRLRAWQKRNQLLARVSDSGFALAFETDETHPMSDVVAEVQAITGRSIEFEGMQFVLPSHIGTATYPRDAGEALPLLQAAEAALHSAEFQREQGHTAYRSLLTVESNERLQLESELRRALQQDELVLYYQPQIDVRSGQMIGLEALVRWQHPRLGLLSPDTFIHMAESAGMMRELGSRVIHSACAQIREWRQQGYQPPRVAINVSASQFSTPELPEYIAALLRDYGLDGNAIGLELTESASMKNPQATTAIMARLRLRDVSLSIDDFGTGYSNLSYLKRFPINHLKLDKAFVQDIADDADDLAIARTIIAMGTQLEIDVIAEGVETEEQLQLLSKAGCHHVQGYLFSPPVPAASCPALFSYPFAPVTGTLRSRKGQRA